MWGLNLTCLVCNPDSQLMERVVPNPLEARARTAPAHAWGRTRSTLMALGIFVALMAAHVRAQGGPPMITDDPGTPGPNHWEVNLAWTDTATPGSSEFGLPLIDANYGVGDRIQLNYQASWNIVRADGDTTSGYSNTQLAVKWRFYDAGEHNLQISMYPRLTFLDPGSASARRGLADANTTFLLPFEFQKEFDWFAVNVDFGHIFCAHESAQGSEGSIYAVDRGWTGGLCIGREVKKNWELDLEWHTTTDDRVGRSEQTVNLGSRIGVAEHATILLAIGSDTSNTLGPRNSLLTYLGVQLTK